MADDIRTDDVDTGTDPATNHDVAEGGILGAIGGAVVGALAGGPVGAVIGAIVGGAASAGAVDAIDKQDHAPEGSEDALENDQADTPFLVAAPGMVPMGTTTPMPLVLSPDLDEPSPSMPLRPREEETLPPILMTGRAEPIPSPESATSDTDAPAWNLDSEIRERAYALYEQRGHTDGHDVEDWLKAERDVLKG